DFEWLDGRGGTRSPFEGPLWDAVQSWVAATEPSAAAVPVCVPGFTDSHWLREAFGTVAYGFFPARTMDAQLAARLIHSADERIAVEDLELGVDCFRHVARTVCGSPSYSRLQPRFPAAAATVAARSGPSRRSRGSARRPRTSTRASPRSTGSRSEIRPASGPRPWRSCPRRIQMCATRRSMPPR